MRSPSFDPLDLELLDRVYELACLYIEADNLCRTTATESVKQREALRKQIFVLAGSGPIKFDPLCDQVLAIIGTSLAEPSGRPAYTATERYLPGRNTALAPASGAAPNPI